MENVIKTDSLSPENEIQYPTSKILADLKHLLYLFEILHRKSQEINLSFIELKKRNPVLNERVFEADKSLRRIFSELSDEAFCLINVLADRFNNNERNQSLSKEEMKN